MAEEYERGRLLSRPARALAERAPVGLHVPGTEAGPAEVYLYVPAGYRMEIPSPLVLLLHGAGEDARDGLAQLRGQADEAGLVLLAPGSRGPTWDLILNRGRYGPDIETIDRALSYAFSRCVVDPARVGVGGYSDGASYALALGLANGDLFSHVLAFSPGFLAPTGQTGAPRVFVSHGTRDRWLPIDSCSRRIVPRLRCTLPRVRRRPRGAACNSPRSSKLVRRPRLKTRRPVFLVRPSPRRERSPSEQCGPVKLGQAID